MKSVLVYTVHKAGSTFLNLLVRQICRRYAIERYSENMDRYFELIAERSWGKFIDQTSSTGCFGPIRATSNQLFFPTRLQDYSIVLHLRDPRDVLTSAFYSFTYSHRIMPGSVEQTNQKRLQWQQEGVDKFVLKSARSLSETYQQLCSKLVGLQNVTVVHYEDMVLDYANWLANFLSAFGHLKIPSAKLRDCFLPQSFKNQKIRQQLYRKHRDAFSVSDEDVFRHKRRVEPGDHLAKLKPETIDQLNKEFEHYFSLLNLNKDQQFVA